MTQPAAAASEVSPPEVPQIILLVTAIQGAETCANGLARQLGVPVEIAASRRLGLAALRRAEYSAVIVDEAIAEADPCLLYTSRCV